MVLLLDKPCVVNVNPCSAFCYALLRLCAKGQGPGCLGRWWWPFRQAHCALPLAFEGSEIWG